MRELYFFIGTEAEIMKMYGVVNQAKKAGIPCKIVSSGQNDISNSKFLKMCDADVDINVSGYTPKKKNGREYIKWLFRTLRYGKKVMKEICSTYGELEKPIMIVHGDTLSTLLGARIAKGAGMRYCHVEGGLRSHNWFNPFPEEIDRYFGSKHADIVFCPGEKATETADKYFQGKAVNTVVNTNYETLNYALEWNKSNEYKTYCTEKYFVAAIHRQENLMNKDFMSNTVESIIELAKEMKCIFIYHQQTELALKKYALYDKLSEDKNVVFINRLDYFEFIDVVEKSEFLLADGAGNQQEMYYLGKPYLVLRDNVELDSEGLGENAVLYNGDFEFVKGFVQEYKKYKREKVSVKQSPSEIIVNTIKEEYFK